MSATVTALKPIQSGKAKAPTDGFKAQGHALAVVCINYAQKRMEEEEKQQSKLLAIVRSIQGLAREAHAEFRAELSKELELVKELNKAAGLTAAHTRGYSMSSFTVLVTNWRTISKAVEMGYDTTDKGWGQVLSESVEMKRQHSASSHEGAQPPTKRTAGRKATPLIEKAIKAMEALETEEDLFTLYNKLEAMMQSKGIIG